MNRIVSVIPLPNFLVKILFHDGLEKVVNLRPFIGKGFTKELLNPEKFNEVFVEPGGGIAWNNGFDFCPNLLRELQDARQIH